MRERCMWLPVTAGSSFICAYIPALSLTSFEMLQVVAMRHDKSIAHVECQGLRGDTSMEIRVQSRPVVFKSAGSGNQNHVEIRQSAGNQKISPEAAWHHFARLPSLNMLAMPRNFECTLHILSADRGEYDPDAFCDPMGH